MWTSMHMILVSKKLGDPCHREHSREETMACAMDRHTKEPKGLLAGRETVRGTAHGEEQLGTHLEALLNKQKNSVPNEELRKHLSGKKVTFYKEK